jgi:hypothetical protein
MVPKKSQTRRYDHEEAFVWMAPQRDVAVMELLVVAQQCFGISVGV